MASHTPPTPPRSAVTEPWTTRRLLKWIEGHLGAKGVDGPRPSAELLVSHVLGCDRLRLYMEADRPASDGELATLRELVARASRHEPVQYLTGEKWFWTKRFAVGPATLIPRDCTEGLVELGVRAARAASAAATAAGVARPVRVLDLCTGTGCVAVCVAAALRGQRRGIEREPGVPAPPPMDVEVVATDLVPGAIELAGRNAAAHGVAEFVSLRQGNLFAALDGLGLEGSFDAVLANPPYVSAAEYGALDANVREYEPRSALWGGDDGLDLVRPIVRQAGAWLRPGALLAIEIGHAQRDEALALARAQGDLRDADVAKDFEGYWRFLTAVRV